jgi:copper chaperone NosL
MKKYQQILMAIAGLLLIPVFWLPLWSIRIVAPQYNDGLGMFIGLRDIWGHTQHDIQNINILNHYIGMKPIVVSEVDVLAIMPWVVGALLVTALVVALLNRRWLVGAWLAAFVLLGSAGMFEFYSWKHDYGHDLSPDAPLKVPGMTYTPPLIGAKTLLNIRATSYPAWGTLMITLSFLSALGAMGLYEGRVARAARSATRRIRSSVVATVAVVSFAACGAPAMSAEPAAAAAEEPCAYCDGLIADDRFGGELVTRSGDVYRFMSTECLAGFVVSGAVARDDIRSVRVVDYDHGKRLIDAETALFVRSDTRESPTGLNILAAEREVVAHNLHFFFGGTRLSWPAVLDLVREEWEL